MEDGLRCFVCLILLCVYCSAAEVVLRPYSIAKWNRRDGMLSASVYAIAQTPDGYLWLGTADGLIRFDGFSFTQIPLSQDDRTAFGRVLALATDAEGTLWIGTEAGKLVRLRVQQFRVVQVADAITGIYADAVTGINVLTEHRVYRFSPIEMQVLAECDVAETRYDLCAKPFLPKVPAAVLAGTHLPSERVIQSVCDQHGVWLATKDHGLIHVMDAGTGKSLKINQIGLSQGLSSEIVRVLFSDREGNLWIGTANGLDRLSWKKFSTATQTEGLLSNNFNEIAASRDAVWAASDSGLNRIDANGNASAVLQGKVLSLAFDGREGVLVGTGKGIMSIKQNRTVLLQIGVRAEHVSSLVANPDGTFFFYDLALGLYRACPGVRAKNIPLKPGSGTVAMMQTDGKSGLWLGFSSGVIAHYDGHAVRQESATSGRQAGTLHFLSLDQKAGLWIASERGLSLLSDGRRLTWSKLNGLPGNRVLWATRGSDGRLWLGFNLGVAAVRFDELERAAADPGYRVQVELYNDSDGLVSGPELKGNQPVATAADGRLWFLTGEGLAVVDPAHMTRNTAPPLPGIVTLMVDDHAMTLSGEARLPKRTRRIEIGYTALSLSEPPNVRFRFRLLNFDDTWHDAGHSRSATYTNLPPGHYKFQVMAANEDGVWSLHPGELSFFVPAAFYQTRWFAAFCIVVLLVSVLLLIRRRVRVATERVRLLFEERAKERARLAQDLHDHLIQDMVGISLQLEIADELIPAGAPGKPVIVRALSLAEEAMSQGRRALTSLRATDLTPRQAFEEIAQVAQRYAAPSRLQGHLATRGRARVLRGNVANEIVHVGMEAVANAMQHTTATVHLHVQQTAGELELHVWDEGPGMVEERLRFGIPDHYGLAGMRERAARLGAQLSVESTVTAGTRVRLHVPGQIAFRQAETPLQRIWQRVDLLLHATHARDNRP